VSEPQHPETQPYLEALEALGDQGFSPLGWLYRQIMEDLAAKGLAHCIRGADAYVLSQEGLLELKRQRGTSK
jgi:hypothetical protein